MNNDFLSKVNLEMSVEENSRFTDPNKMELAPEVKSALINEILELHHKYDYDSTVYGVEKIVDTWWENKGRQMTQLFGAHPNYVPGKFQIAFDQDYERKIDFSNCYEFVVWFKNRLIENAEGVMVGEATLPSIGGRVCRYGYAARHYGSCGLLMYKFMTDRVSREVNIGSNAINDVIYTGESSFLDENVVQKVADVFSVRVAAGQKKSRAINKICKKLGFDKDPEYNKVFAKLADALNPLNIVRHTVISWNPVDYYTMSFGNSWSSCHTIDKKNIRDMPNSYEGQYSGGTQSYLLDSTSVVFYTVDKDYDGNELELQPKINRCMFHISPNKDFFVQGRVYPQDNDRDDSIYKSIREIMQKIVADMWKLPNLWVLRKGTDECEKVIDSYGSNYKDYYEFDSCNVSVLKEKAELSLPKITVGRDGICPVCGTEHSEEETITCYECAQNVQTCELCGEKFELAEMHEIDGRYYCEHCVEYCKECESYHPKDEVTYVSGYGGVCGSCLGYSDNFTQCDGCDEWLWIRDEDVVTTHDGCVYCSRGCAMDDGYVYVDEEEDWYEEEDCRECESCGEWVLKEGFDSEKNMCNWCAENSREITFEDEPVSLENIA